MTTQTDTAAAIAAFLAKGGKVAKVATGANSGISDRQFYLASRGDVSLKTDYAADENLSERQMETFRETRHAGGSVSQALDDMNSVKLENGSVGERLAGRWMGRP